MFIQQTLLYVFVWAEHAPCTYHIPKLKTTSRDLRYIPYRVNEIQVSRTAEISDVLSLRNSTSLFPRTAQHHLSDSLRSAHIASIHSLEYKFFPSKITGNQTESEGRPGGKGKIHVNGYV